MSESKQVKVNEKAAIGFGEGTNDHYDKARPIYPALSLSHLHSTLPLRPLRILELGSGTGLFSRLLLSPPPPSSTLPSTPAGTLPSTATTTTPFPVFEIESLVAVEPSKGMRDAWDKGLTALEARGWERGGRVVKTVEGGFDDLSKVREMMGEEWRADLIVIAQAWHWAHPEYDAGIKEMETMLAKDGIISFIWNFERQQSPWNRSIRAIESRNENDSPQQHKGWWHATFSGATYKACFRERERKGVWWDQVVDDDYIVDRCFSKSYMTVLTTSEKEATTREILDALSAEDAGKVWVDESKGTFVLPWETDLIIIRRK